MFHFCHYTDILENELNFRKRNNPRYSLRGFAKLIETSPSSLSEILKKKQGLSAKKAESICHKLNYSNLEKEYFCSLVLFHNGRTIDKRREAQETILNIRSKKFTIDINQDSQEIISHWYHFAIIELVKIRKVPHSPSFISENLNIDFIQAQTAINLLKKYNLIRVNEGYLQPTGLQIPLSEEIPKIAIRHLHKSLLVKAEQAIERESNLHFDTSIMAVNQNLLPEIQKKISQFKKELNFFIANHEQNKSPDSIYCYSGQFFELTGKQ